MTSMSVPVTHSLITGEAVAALVSREYELVTTGAARLLLSGLNDHYLLPTRDGESLSDQDLGAVPVFAAIRVIWLLGLWCANAHIVGYFYRKPVAPEPPEPDAAVNEQHITRERREGVSDNAPL